jgi:hypothetical protein
MVYLHLLNLDLCSTVCLNWWHAVALKVEALFYKPEGLGFESDVIEFLQFI